MSDGDVVMKANGAEETKEDTSTITANGHHPKAATSSSAPLPPSSPSPVAPPSTPAQSTKNAEAERFKEEGNRLFADKHFAKATDCYTKGAHATQHSATPSPSPHLRPAPLAPPHLAVWMCVCPAAIEVDPSNAVYYSNRAFCHIRLEAYGSAIEDATKAIECDKQFIKVQRRQPLPYTFSCPPTSIPR